MRLLSSASLSLLLLRSAALLPLSHAAILDDSPPVAALAVLPPGMFPGGQDIIQEPIESQEHEFSLRHIFHHGTHKYPDLHRRLDVPKDAAIRIAEEDGSAPRPMPRLRAKSNVVQIQRLADRSRQRIDALLDTGRHRGEPVALDASHWTVDDMPGPNFTDKETVLTFARISANAYVMDHDDLEWEDIKHNFNYTTDFGWKNDGLRGHVFADTENKTVIIGLKGTSPAVFDGSETTANDKINDNLFFSCCCGQGGQYSWKQVCECKTSAYRCNSTCVVEALRVKNRYYYAAQEIYRNVSEIYPDASIWLSGHSLGGATSALVSLTYGVPTMTFEAPGDAMAAKRLGLPTPPGYNYGFHQERTMTGIYQWGHTADPIFMGTCNSINSFCSIAGYAMQSKCHTGNVCEYDTVKDFGWRSGVGNHRIKVVLKDVLEKYPELAKCEVRKNCTDCYEWDYFESHSSSVSSKTKSSTTTSTTRTSTCKTPGWFGCLDESTTTEKTTSVSTTTTTTTTTTTCETPGWFGCKDSTSNDGSVTATTAPSHATIITVTETSFTTASPSSAPAAPTPSPTSATPTSSATTSSCQHPGWFGCKDPTSTTASTEAPKPTHTTAAPGTGSSSSCVERAWWGGCREWRTSKEEIKFDL